MSHNDPTSDLHQLAAALCRIEDRDVRLRLTTAVTALAESLAASVSADDDGVLLPSAEVNWSSLLSNALLPEA